ncbi:MAG: hypothetical protein IPL40_05790 [Proteobacteria bacterium]|nr:hypothetical protein [Pseudomonadota bacterium]
MKLLRHGQGAVPAGEPYFFDPRVAFTQALSQRWNYIVHFSLAGWGAELRCALNNAEAAAPLVLRLGAQSDGLAGLISEGFAWEARAGLSAQPRLTSWLRALVGVSATFGKQRRVLESPDEARHPLACRHGCFFDGFNVLRNETRLEFEPGLSFDFSRARFVVAAQPFYVVQAGRISDSWCTGCADGAQLHELSGNWGTTFTLTAYYGIPAYG